MAVDQAQDNNAEETIENIENFLWSMPEENFRVENFPDTAMEQRFSIVKKAYQFLYGTLLN